MSDISQPSAPPPSAPAPSSPPAPARSPRHKRRCRSTRRRSTSRRRWAIRRRPSHRMSPGRRRSQKAFDRAKQAQEEAAAKAPPKRAKPGMGHNQPPEPTAEGSASRKPPQRSRNNSAMAASSPATRPRHSKSCRCNRSKPQTVTATGKFSRLPRTAPYREPPDALQRAGQGRMGCYAGKRSRRGPPDGEGIPGRLRKVPWRHRGDGAVAALPRPCHQAGHVAAARPSTATTASSKSSARTSLAGSISSCRTLRVVWG